jgi:hypothetical protein
MMNRWILSLAAKLGLFGLSLGLGVVSYLVAHDLRQDDAEGQPATRVFTPVTAFQSEVVIDAEPQLLAKVESPVDAVGDALGIYYLLEADGDLVRVAPTVGGGTEATHYASLADARTDAAIGFSNLALHPNFLMKNEPGYGCFYVTAAEHQGSAQVDFSPEFGGGTEHHQDVLYEYTVEDPLLPEFRGTRRELMRLSQPGADHNVRGLTFDPTGQLYIGVGDGAVAEVGKHSPSRNASSLMNVYGKVLRIDPLGRNSANGQYGIPDGNPFRLVSEALPELWVFGLRAPQSLSYDSIQRGLCIAESAGSGRDEVNLSLYGGEHYGWDIGENADRLNRAARARLEEVVTGPAVSLDRLTNAVARTSGSVIYRGEQFPSLAGNLLIASHDGQLLAMRPSDAGSGVPRLAKVDLTRFGKQHFTALRQGPRGEVILLCESGEVFEMRKSASLGTGNSKQRALFCEVGGEIEPRG